MLESVHMADPSAVDFEREIARLRNRFLEKANAAVNSITELAEMADSEQVRLAAAVKLLGLIGMTEVQKQEIDHTVRRAQEEVDHELATVLNKLEEGRAERRLEAQKELGTGAVEEILDADLEEDDPWEGLETGGAHTGDVPQEGLQETLDDQPPLIGVPIWVSPARW